MKTVTGKYGNAVIYTDLVDEKSLEQVRELLDQPFTEGYALSRMAFHGRMIGGRFPQIPKKKEQK